MKFNFEKPRKPCACIKLILVSAKYRTIRAKIVDREYTLRSLKAIRILAVIFRGSKFKNKLHSGLIS